MTEEQFNHYIKGGKFKAILDPVKKDSTELNLKAGQEIVVHQNIINNPIQSPPEWIGQYAFNSDSIRGWFPEEDITITEILDEYVEHVQPLPVYLYRLTYLKQESLMPNFGNGNWKAPIVITREYAHDMNEFILNLSNPQADKIEKAVWQGKYNEEIKWKKLL